MLRTPKKEISLNVSSCQIINDGHPFLRVTCQSILVSPDQRKLITDNKNWYLDGAGGPIKVMNVPQFHTRHHMPNGEPGAFIEGSSVRGGGSIDRSGFAPGIGHFTTDLVIDLFMPKGVIEIQFTKYNDEMEALRRANEEAQKIKQAEIEEKERVLEAERKKAESPVKGFRRTFKNLDLDTDE